MPKRFQTVFFKLLFTYSLLLIVIIVFVGIASYIMISKMLNEEIERNDRELLTYVETMSDHSVFNTVQKLYQKLVVPSYDTVDMMLLFNETQLDDNLPAVYDAHQYLKGIVESQYNVVDSIDFYFLKSNSVTSSDLALHQVDRDNEDSWFKEIGRVTDQNHWFVTKANDPKGGRTNAITFIGPYPDNANERAKGYIAIRVNELALSNILKQSVNQNSSQLFILTANDIVSRSSRVLPADLSFTNKIRSYSAADGHFITEIDGINTIVSFRSLESSGWKIVRLTSVEQFYSKTTYMRNMLVLIGALALLIGYGISTILAGRIYNPLKSIADTARRIFGDETGASVHPNEYKQINALINNLSVKVTSLETTLHANLPLIKSRLLSDLFQGKIHSRQDLEERLELLHLKLQPDQRYTFLILELDYELMSHLSLENRQFIIYSLIDAIDGNDDVRSDVFRLASESPAHYRIEVLVHASQSDGNAVAGLIREWSSYLASNFFVTMIAFAGCWETDPLQLHRSYKQTEALFKYAYFAPSEQVFYMEDLLKREESTELFEEGLLEDFVRVLKAKRPDQVKDSLQTFMKAVKTSDCSADYGHKMLRELVYVYYRFVKDMNLSTREILTKKLFADFETIRNVEEFERWMLDVLETTFSFMEQNHPSKSTEIIRTVKQFVSGHLSGELSLEIVAGVVFLSPRYLSKVFKQETGENFVDFVTKERMNSAEKMIVSTNETIENIAILTGYNNPAYFTKRFKETFGVTPSVYREKREWKSS